MGLCAPDLPVAVFGQKVLIDALHQILEPRGHVGLLHGRLRLDDLKTKKNGLLLLLVVVVVVMVAILYSRDMWDRQKEVSLHEQGNCVARHQAAPSRTNYINVARHRFVVMCLALKGQGRAFQRDNYGHKISHFLKTYFMIHLVIKWHHFES
jgi:hypothetical protein